ncbi:MAG: magnesium/cobalt transporter CorA [Chlamydiia bacterium]|nr:magnesium/cobalt transporter CorA [Chlamydiia bacterium]
MLRVFSPLREIKIVASGDTIDVKGVWYDLYNPQPEEIARVENCLALKIPTLDEMHAIETSSRFFQEDRSFYMTVNLIASSDSQNPISSPVTFILREHELVTIRYVDPKPFLTFSKKAEKNFKKELSPAALFLSLLEMIVDRIADIVEEIGNEVDFVSKEIFCLNHSKNDRQRAMKEILSHIGKKGDLNSNARLSVDNINRLLKFIRGKVFDEETVAHYEDSLTILQQDVNSIMDHIAFQVNKINFLLDATLGLINIEQNATVKIFSVVAVIFLPPTLLASIYGMNFAFMPELKVAAGYPLALVFMILSAVFPYLYFKRKGWLQ